jgi:hypothetical protein
MVLLIDPDVAQASNDLKPFPSITSSWVAFQFTGWQHCLQPELSTATRIPSKLARLVQATSFPQFNADISKLLFGVV